LIQKRTWTIEADAFIRYVAKRVESWSELQELLGKAYPEYSSKTTGAIRSRFAKYEKAVLEFPRERINELGAKAKEDYERVKKSGVHRS
jgi:hypothetical protein